MSYSEYTSRPKCPNCLKILHLRLRYSTTIRLGLSQVLHALWNNSEGHTGVNLQSLLPLIQVNFSVEM